MVAMAPATVEVKSAGFDIDGSCDATFWKGQDQPDIDWNDEANMLLMGLDRKGKVIQWNDRAQELTDFSQSELKFYSFAHHLMSRPFAGLVDNVLERTWEGKDVGCFQIPFFTKSGAKLQLVVHAFRFASGPSEYVLLKALTADDAARRRAARNNAVMTIHVDLDGNVKEWDAGARQVSDFMRAEMLGKDFVNTLIPATERQALEEAFMQSLMCKEHHLTTAVPFLTKTGATTWVMFRTLPEFRIRDEQITEQLAGVVFVGYVIDQPHTQEQEWTATSDSLPPMPVESYGRARDCYEDGDKGLSFGMPSTCATLDSLGEIGF